MNSGNKPLTKDNEEFFEVVNNTSVSSISHSINSDYKPLTKDNEELFEVYSKSIDKKVRETFPSIPSSFKLKPTTVRAVLGCGIFYDFKVALPDGKFAKVSFHEGGYPIQRAPGEPEPEPMFNVDPTPTATAEE